MTTVNQVDIGNLPNDAQGDPLRVAFAKINDNFNYLSSLAPEGPEGAVQYIKDGLSAGDANLVVNQSTGVLDINLDTIPLVDDVLNLGSESNRFAHLYLGDNGVSIGNVTINQVDGTLSFPVTGGTVPENASLNINNLATDGNVLINGTLTVGARKSGEVETVTHNNSANQEVFIVPVPDFDNGTFQITTRSLVNQDSQKVTIEVLKSTSNTGVKYSAFGTVFSGSPLTRYNVDVGYNNVRVMVNPMLNSEMVHAVTYTINT